MRASSSRECDDHDHCKTSKVVSPIEAEDFVLAAVGWINTPWKHATKIKGLGIDCAQLIIASLQEAGCKEVEEVTEYSLFDEFYRLVRELRKYFKKVPLEQRKRGDLLVFRSNDILNHVAICTGKDTFIHSYQAESVGRVVEDDLHGYWRSRVIAVYRYKNLKK